MMSKESALRKRGIAYGEHREFYGLEAYSISRRLKQARGLLGRLVIQKPKAEVLELGCGYWGNNLRLLHQEYPHIKFTGVDLSVSKGVTGIQLVQADIFSWNPHYEYDAVLSLAVVEHLLNPQAHFRLLAHCTKAHGLVGLTTPTPQSHFILKLLAWLKIFDRSEIDDHKNYLTETGIRNLAENTGFSTEEFRTFSAGMNQWALLRKK